jgi:hypothetical protein
MYARMLAAFWRSCKVTMRIFWRLTRQLFHEATGAFFIVFSAWAAFAAWKQWKHRPAVWLLAFAIVYAILMAFYAVSSFRRARRVR